MEEVEVVFKTDLGPEFQVNQNSFMLSRQVGRRELNDLVNHLLQKNLSLGFLIFGQDINSSLHEAMQLKNISSEGRVEVWYFLQVPEPESGPPRQCRDWVGSVKISENATVCADYAGVLYITQKKTKEIQAHERAIRAIDVNSENGDCIVTGDVAGVIKVWSLDSEQELGFGYLQEPVKSICWNPPGDMFAIGGSRGNVYLSRFGGGEQVIGGKKRKLDDGISFTNLEIPVKDCVTGIVWPYLDRFYTSSLDNTIMQWDLERSAVANTILTQKSPQCLDVNYNWLASGFEDGSILMWDANTSKKSHAFKSDSWVRAIKLHNSYIITGTENGSLQIWDPRRESEAIHTISAHSDKILSLDARGSKAITGSADCSYREHSLK